MAIVQSLFGDMLPPQRMDGGAGGIRPVMPRDPMGQPPVQPRPVMTQPQQPVVTQQEPTVPQIDLSKLNLSGLNLPDFTGSVDSGMFNIGMTQQQTPQNPTDFFNQYTEFLSGVQSGNTANKVNRRDDIYNNFFQQVGIQYQGNPQDFRASVGLSDAFSMYDDPTVQINSQSLQEAYQSLSGAEDRLAVLSDYYGFDITPAVNEGANYRNAAKYGTSQENMAEFQSIIEPILQKSIPYIQATQGLEYTDALEYAYTHDPMIAALYNQYGVDLYRSTDDGSTYIFDPIAGQEIRTLEVKDPKFKDIAPALAGIALAFTGVPAALGGAFGASGATAGAIGQGLVSTATAALGGARGSDLLKAGVLGAVGGYTRGLGTELTQLNEAASAAQAAGDVATAANLASQASTLSSQLNMVNTISNTARAIDAIANENYVGAVLIGLEQTDFSLRDWTADKLSTTFGADEVLGINTDDLAVGINSFGINMLKGDDPEDALKSAVVDYAKAGGSFPDLGIELPEIGSSDFFDAVMDSQIIDTLRQLGRDFDDTILQPVVNTIEQTGSAIDDSIIQPIREGLKDIDIPTPDVDLPDVDVDFPDVDLPSLDLDLDLNLDSVFAGGSGGGSADVSTRATPELMQIERTVSPAELFGYTDYLQQLTRG